MADPLASSAPKQAQAQEQVQELGLLDQIVEQSKLSVDPATRERGKNLVKEFVSQVLEGSMTVSRDTEAMITPASRRSTTCSPSS